MPLRHVGNGTIAFFSWLNSYCFIRTLRVFELIWINVIKENLYSVSIIIYIKKFDLQQVTSEKENEWQWHKGKLSQKVCYFLCPCGRNCPRSTVCLHLSKPIFRPQIILHYWKGSITLNTENAFNFEHRGRKLGSVRPKGCSHQLLVIHWWNWR